MKWWQNWLIESCTTGFDLPEKRSKRDQQLAYNYALLIWMDYGILLLSYWQDLTMPARTFLSPATVVLALSLVIVDVRAQHYFKVNDIGYRLQVNNESDFRWWRRRIRRRVLLAGLDYAVTISLFVGVTITVPNNSLQHMGMTLMVALLAVPIGMGLKYRQLIGRIDYKHSS